MASEIYVRRGWAIIRLFYLPAMWVGASLIRGPLGLMLAMRGVLGCGLCMAIHRLAHRVEETANRDPWLRIDEGGLIVEDGGAPRLIPWRDFKGVLIRRYVPLWKTGGGRSMPWHPPYRLEIIFQGVGVHAKGYMQHERKFSLDEAQDNISKIEVWPGQVEGGLLRVVRFGKALQAQLARAGVSPLD